MLATCACAIEALKGEFKAFVLSEAAICGWVKGACCSVGGTRPGTVPLLIRAQNCFRVGRPFDQQSALSIDSDAIVY